jgi:hypothetical protein
MPRILIFAPCEKVILGQGDNSASLITIIRQMQFQVPVGQAIPEGAGVFARLSIFCQWHRLPTDANRVFEQRIVLSLGNENPVLESVAEFQMTEPLHRLTVNVPLLPILHPGEYSLKLFLREKGQQDWGSAIAEYPLGVTHVTELQPQS